jgi:hypothetical protein
MSRMTFRDFDLWLVSRARELPCPMNKESSEEKAAQQQQMQFSQQLMQVFNTQFGEQQSILGMLTPQLESMATNPQGFGAIEYAALQSQIVNDVGSQYSSAAKSAAREFATTDEAGLPSGAEQEIQANLTGAAAGEVASQSTGLAVANQQLKQEQQQFALGALSGEAGTLGSEMESTGGETIQGTGQAFNEAATVFNQGSLWQNILGGLVQQGIGAGTTALGMAIPGQAGNIVGNIGV